MTLLPELERALVHAAGTRRRRRPQHLALVAAAALLLAGVAAAAVSGRLVSFGGVSATEQPASKPNLSVLDAPATEADRLPAAARNSGAASEFADVDAARSVGAFKGAKYYLVPGKNDGLCIVKTAGANIGVVCSARARARLLSGLWLGTIDEPPDRTVAIVAPDGYRSGETRDTKDGPRGVTFGRNIAFTTVSRAGGEVSLTAAEGPPITVQIPPRRRSGSSGPGRRGGTSAPRDLSGSAERGAGQVLRLVAYADPRKTVRR